MHSIVWLTGPSGAGKTTLARAFQKDWPCVVLDGDEMRWAVSEGAGFSRNDRAEHNYRVARLAKVLARQMNVLVSVIAPIKEVRDNIEGVTWIYLKKTMPEREGHFYEVSPEYPMIDCDIFNLDQRLTVLNAAIAKNKTD